MPLLICINYQCNHIQIKCLYNRAIILPKLLLLALLSLIAGKYGLRASDTGRGAAVWVGLPVTLASIGVGREIESIRYDWREALVLVVLCSPICVAPREIQLIE